MFLPPQRAPRPHPFQFIIPPRNPSSDLQHQRRSGSLFKIEAQLQVVCTAPKCTAGTATHRPPAKPPPHMLLCSQPRSLPLPLPAEAAVHSHLRGFRLQPFTCRPMGSIHVAALALQEPPPSPGSGRPQPRTLAPSLTHPRAWVVAHESRAALVSRCPGPVWGGLSITLLPVTPMSQQPQYNRRPPGNRAGDGQRPLPTRLPPETGVCGRGAGGSGTGRGRGAGIANAPGAVPASASRPSARSRAGVAKGRSELGRPAAEATGAGAAAAGRPRRRGASASGSPAWDPASRSAGRSRLRTRRRRNLGGAQAPARPARLPGIPPPYGERRGPIPPGACSLQPAAGTRGGAAR